MQIVILTLHANCPLIALSVKAYFLEKTKKNISKCGLLRKIAEVFVNILLHLISFCIDCEISF